MRTICIPLAFLLVAMNGLRSQEPGSCSCCSDIHRAFDFWIGKWEVRQADGKLAGINRVEKMQEGCWLQEHWESARPGYRGTSLNYFNNQTGQWEQLWVDTGGNVLKLKGRRHGNQMILASEPLEDSTGGVSVNRITWTLLEDGRVRQLWEVVAGDGPAKVLFDGYYSRMEE